MKIYLSAFVGAFFLMMFVGILAESLVWMIFNFFHASRAVILSAESLMLLPLLIAFGFMFRHTLNIEKGLAEQGY